ncbi:Malonyl CoA-acyl carrier protein transacylase [Fasciola hepatica]|uniref:Malonyl CoA-acyl carrier protein transacylase n=1 Tax=Fasciola hepatica TaxID=6192 RepID=A0A4E0R9B7_FASHE|nr:Malonyl CoA-acyl carrier protein transacylase [Fasciola hepatica]
MLRRVSPFIIFGSRIAISRHLKCNFSAEESEVSVESVSVGKSKWLQYENRPLDLDPESTSIFLFPGQGSQFVGMGKELVQIPRIRQMFNCANEILRTDLLKTCLDGPSSKLNQTIHCQPAVYTVSLAAVSKLQEDEPSSVENCVAAAGFSLGEITALVFSGALTFEQGLHLVRVRAQFMQQACDRVKGAMCSVFLDNKSQLKLAILAAKNHCQAKLGIDDVHCAVVNYLYAECKVLAGHLKVRSFIVYGGRYPSLFLPLRNSFNLMMS